MPKEGRQEVEVKANWGRARKRYGPGATDIVVMSRKNDVVGVSEWNFVSRKVLLAFIELHCFDTLKHRACIVDALMHI